MTRYKALTFDFWGTLVDVDTSGIMGMARVLNTLGLDTGQARQLYFQWDEATVRRYRSGSWRPYLEWGAMGLEDVLQTMTTSDHDWIQLAETLISTMTAEAKPHPEVTDIIRQLKEKLPLMPITNMDRSFFDLNPFRAEFELTLTAEEAGAFKPSALIFAAAIRKLDVKPEDILHVSLSQFADLEGAMPMGLDVAWINRGHETLGRLTPRPRFELSDLKGLPMLL